MNRTLLYIACSLFVLVTVAVLWPAMASAQRNKSFDAVGGGPASAMSFASASGTAMRFYPPGSKPGYKATSNFQGMNHSSLFRRLEGMEGSIWGQNVWAAQKKAEEAAKAAQKAKQSKRFKKTSQEGRNAQASKASVTVPAKSSAPTPRKVIWPRKPLDSLSSTRDTRKQSKSASVRDKKEQRLSAKALASHTQDRSWWNAAH